MPVDAVTYYNKIDIGIFLLFLDLCLEHNDIKYDRKLYVDNINDDTEKILIAKYVLNE